MKWKVYAVYDRASDIFTPPFNVRAEAEAVRSFQTAVKKGAFPGELSDFWLYYLADWDDTTGEYHQSVDQHKRLCSAAEVVKDDFAGPARGRDLPQG